MNPLTFLYNLVKEKRNYAIAESYHYKTPSPVFSTWSLKSAVKDGYKKNPWVYRSVFLKAKAGASVNWYVADSDGKKIDGHPLTILFDRPNPFISRQDLFELIIAWLELTGNSYMKKVLVGGQVKELWPISPDRLKPVPTKNVIKWMEGYSLDQSRKVTFQPEEIIHNKYFNPANPLLGISPLEAVAKSVDIDNAQKDFNLASTQNRGVIDGVFSFERNFASQDEADAVSDRLNEKYRGKRTFGVLGSNAKYIRTALTPVEMDFLNSGRKSMEEIFVAFGVPPVYAGIMQAATLNNYKTSELVFWFGTMLFLLDDLKDTFNFSLSDQLKPGEQLVYDLSGVPAIREAMLSKTKVAKNLYDMGVPFKQLNKIFKLGFQEFEGWEQSNPLNQKSTEQVSQSERSTMKRRYTLVEKRASNYNKLLKKQEKLNQKVIHDLLQTQQESIFDFFDEKGITTQGIDEKIAESTSLWKDALEKIYIETSLLFGADMVIEKRSIEDDLTKEIEKYLYQEDVVLTEISLMDETTATKIVNIAKEALGSGATMNEVQQAIVDCGIFDEKRALMLSRTITGTASNLGQIYGASLAGATMKTWTTAGFEVRESHQALEGQTIKIDEYFIVGSEKALFPLDNRLSPGERVNCRCTLFYSVGE